MTKKETGRLLHTIKPGQKIQIGPDVVVEYKRGIRAITLMITAPKDIGIVFNPEETPPQSAPPEQT